jgi:hypothetical protein
MPGFPFPGRPGGEHDEPLLDMIITRRALPPDAPQEMHDLARMLAALAGPAEPGELAGEAAVRAAFSRAASPAGISAAARRPLRRRRPRHRGRERSRVWLAAAMVAAVAGLGSVLAAYSDVLPSPIQQLAHVAVAAPAPPRAGPPRPGTLGTGRPAPRPVTGQPAARPRHSAGVAPAAGQATSAYPRLTPETSRSGDHDRTSASCAASLWPSPGPSAKASARPSPSSKPPTVPCVSIPTWPAPRRSLNQRVP